MHLLWKTIQNAYHLIDTQANYFQILKIVRENSIVIIVGETGSGKTTQLTQVSVVLYSLELK